MGKFGKFVQFIPIINLGVDLIFNLVKNIVRLVKEKKQKKENSDV